MTEFPTPIPLKAARALALHTQGLAAKKSPKPTRETIYQMAENLGAVQIDTLQMVARSQYILMWSRLGTYDPADFDALIFEPGERFRLRNLTKHQLVKGTIHPYRGEWMEFDVEHKPGKDVTAGTRVARKRRLGIFTMLRALGYDTEEILAAFFDTNTFRDRGDRYELDLIADRLRGERHRRRRPDRGDAHPVRRSGRGGVRARRLSPHTCGIHRAWSRRRSAARRARAPA